MKAERGYKNETKFQTCSPIRDIENTFSARNARR